MAAKIRKLEEAEKARTAIPKETPKETPKPAADAKLDTKTDFNRIEFASRSEVGKAAIAKLKGMGMDDDGVSAVVDLIGELSGVIANKTIQPRFIETDFKNALDEFSANDKYKFAMSKSTIRKEIESYIRTAFKNTPEKWTDPDLIRIAYLDYKDNHPELFSQGKREIVEGDAIHSESEGKGNDIDINAVKSFAKSQGMDFETKDDKDTATKAYAAYKAVMKKKGD
jgi:hypothetical protein